MEPVRLKIYKNKTPPTRPFAQPANALDLYSKLIIERCSEYANPRQKVYDNNDK